MVMPGGNAGCSCSMRLLDALGDVERIGFGQLEDGEAGGRLPVELERLAVLLGAKLDAGDVAQPRDAGRRSLVSALTMMSSNCGDIVEPARHVDRVLELAAGGHRRDAQLSGPVDPGSAG